MSRPSGQSTTLQSFSTRTILRALLGLAFLACVSCGGGKQYYPVHGKVLVNGKPAEGVLVVFSMVDNPDPEPPRPTAGTKEDGSFEIKTYLTKDRVLKTGAPAGKYVVTCLWLPPEAAHLGPGQPVPDRLQGRYMDPKSSTLQVEVPEHAVDLPPFELQVE